MCKKEESEEVIQRSGEGEKGALAKILEEEEDETETSGSTTARTKESGS